MNQPLPRNDVNHEISRLLELRQPDPHRVLGLHRAEQGFVVRAFHPEAERVDVLPDAGGRVLMERRSDGLFEASFPAAREPFGYLLELTYPGGQKYKLRDPYTFLPTLGELDLYFAGEGRHERLWERLGAHPIHHGGVSGVAFAVWAPTAAGVSIVGDFNGWDGRLHPMRRMGASGIWELFVPEIGEGTRYKYEIRPGHGGPRLLKADPFAFRTETPPLTASVVHDLRHYRWGDGEWLARRAQAKPHLEPQSVYEVHLGSWRRVIEEDNRPLTYRELAHSLGDYVKHLGFTHVELLPISEHPYGGSWGYQVSAYYAPTARYGHPDDLRYFIDVLHQKGIGVIIDWVPGHFPRDAFALAYFDGTALYEHEDPRLGSHPDWGTLIFNYGRNEVRNFLIANALFWIDEYHIDGLRVDAVASMLYRDYSRAPGEWVPNRFGGRENEEAISFLKELNETVGRRHPGAIMIAEESTAWPAVSRPTSTGGLGFAFKWNMGWMHDTLLYMSKDPIFRRYHHNELTFGMLYAFHENFVLPLSHDEVVHGKGSLAAKMPGDAWQQLANLRALYGWMWGFPGKKLLFMGGEFGQWSEWNHDQSLDWHLCQWDNHSGVQRLIADLNRLYRAEPSLHQVDYEGHGFHWLQADSADTNTYGFIRWNHDRSRHALVLANMSPTPRYRYRVGAPRWGRYREAINTDASAYGGSGMGNYGSVEAHGLPWDGQPASIELDLPPLSVLFLIPE